MSQGNGGAGERGHEGGVSPQEQLINHHAAYIGQVIAWARDETAAGTVNRMENPNRTRIFMLPEPGTIMGLHMMVQSGTLFETSIPRPQAVLELSHRTSDPKNTLVYFDDEGRLCVGIVNQTSAYYTPRSAVAPASRGVTRDTTDAILRSPQKLSTVDYNALLRSRTLPFDPAELAIVADHDPVKMDEQILRATITQYGGLQHVPDLRQFRHEQAVRICQESVAQHLDRVTLLPKLLPDDPYPRGLNKFHDDPALLDDLPEHVLQMFSDRYAPQGAPPYEPLA